MKVTNFIENKIKRLPKGFVFTCDDLIINEKTKEAAIKALNRMVASGKISKLSKGRYYKLEITKFGNLQPCQYQIVKDLLEDGNKIMGYLTGYAIYSQLGLTAQVSNIIQIGKNEIRPSFKRGNCTISFIKQKNIITKDNIPLLQILDSIRYIKKIPDANNASSSKRLLSIVNNLSKKEQIAIVRLAQKYPPATRALLGALLDSSGNSLLALPLRKSLNSITVYKISGLREILSTAKKWNIQ